MQVNSDYHNKGVGTALMKKMTEYVFSYTNVERIELEVNCDNEAGIALYKKCGFIIEDTKHKSVRKNGKLVDNYIILLFR